MQRRIRVRTPNRLNERTDHVIVLVPRPVVPDNGSLGRLGRVPLLNHGRPGTRPRVLPTVLSARVPLSLRRGGRRFQHGQRPACISTGDRHDVVERLLGQFELPRQTPRVLHRACHQGAQVFFRQRFELQHQGPRHQRRNHRKRRVLGGRRHQHHQPVLDRRQQRVLLRLGKPMYLVQEQHRSEPAHLPVAPGVLDHLAHVLHTRCDRRQLHEPSPLGVGHRVRNGGLPHPGRAVQNDRGGPGYPARVRLSELPQWRALKRQMVLPHEFVDRARAHTNGQGIKYRSPGRVVKKIHSYSSSSGV